MIVSSMTGTPCLGAFLGAFLNAFAGEEPARESDEEITFYKSIGVPIQDLVTALRIAQRARNRASAPRST
jgi:ornithine cyclodeaminase/alanine dehydrogenase-like protein (mu-crystallin family)